METEATYPFSYWTALGALSFFPSVNNNFYPHCISFGTIPERHDTRKHISSFLVIQIYMSHST